LQISIYFILLVAGIINHFNPSDKKGTNQQIKYDLEDKKKMFKSAVILTCLLILALLLSVFLDSSSGKWWLIGVEALAIFIGSPLVIALWVYYVDCVFYLKRLHRHGYEIPERKKDYDDKQLSQLKRIEGEQKGITKESVVLAVICWIIAVGLAMRAVVFWWEYRTIQDMVMFCMVVFGMLVVCWIVFGICYWRQRLNSKFRDDVEPDTERKLRVSVSCGLGFIVFMVFLNNIGVWFLDQGIKYVINSREHTYREEQNMIYNEEN